MIVKDLLPFRIVESEGLRSLLSAVSPAYNIPTRRKLVDLVDSNYRRLQGSLQKDIQGQFIALTTDMWTDCYNTKAYLGITMHQVKRFKLHSYVIGVSQFESTHTAQNIADAIFSVLSTYNIQTALIQGITTDNARNMVLAAQTVAGKDKQFGCFAHLLNLVCQKSLEKTANVMSLIGKVRDIVTHFKHSTNASTALMNSQASEGTVVCLKLKRDVVTRWNSVYLMIARFLELQRHVYCAIRRCKVQLTVLDSDEIELLNDIADVLQPLFKMTTEISSEKHVTLSKVIPMVRCASIFYSKESFKSKVAEELKRNILAGFEERFHSILSSEIYLIATLLDPRFKRMYFNANESASVTKLILSIIGDDFEVETQIVGQSTDKDIWQYHDDINSTETDSKKELNRYLVIPPLDRKEDPLTFWSKHGSSFPKLSALAAKYLVIPATLVPSERLFSKTGAIISDRRSRIRPSKVEAIAFLSGFGIDDMSS